MDKTFLSKVSALALNEIFGYEPRFSHRIIDALGSSEAVFTLPEDEKIRVFGPYSRYLPLINDSSLEKAELQLARLEAEGYSVLSIYDEDYPSLLRECEDAPMALYLRSGSQASEVFNNGVTISIVGTRDISLYGKEWCERIVKALSQAPSAPCIVSGMAIGVDITAHMAALCFGIPTIGVIPVGINDIYPRRHRVAADKIAAAKGCALITDYPPGTTATAFNFLRRNRIIAGMSNATILIESKVKGGGMMTCRLASGYGREVFVLPGRIDDARSAGCNLLVREKLADPIFSIEELPEALGLGVWNRKKNRGLEEEIRSRYSEVLSGEDTESLVSIALLVKGRRGITYDEICSETGLSWGEVTRLAGILDNDGFLNIDLLQRCSINAKNY